MLGYLFRWMYVNKQYRSLHLIFTKLFIYWLQAAFLEACQAAKLCGACRRALGEAPTLKQVAVLPAEEWMWLSARTCVITS